MWTIKNRARYNRDHLRSPSDVTEEEWAVIAPPRYPAFRYVRRTSTLRAKLPYGLKPRPTYRYLSQPWPYQPGPHQR